MADGDLHFCVFVLWPEGVFQSMDINAESAVRAL